MIVLTSRILLLQFFLEGGGGGENDYIHKKQNE